MLLEKSVQHEHGTLKVSEVEKKVFTLKEAAAYLLINYQRAYRLVKAGLLPHYRNGKQILITKGHIEVFVKGELENIEA